MVVDFAIFIMIYLFFVVLFIVMAHLSICDYILFLFARQILFW